MTCPLLLSTFRGLVINKVSIKPLATLIQLNIRHKYTKFTDNRIREEIGLPTKPKIPLAPIFRYMNEIRNSVMAKHSTLPHLQLISLMAKMWHSEDVIRKEKFIKDFKIEMVNYWEQLNEYNKTCTAEDIKKLKAKKAEILREIERRKIIRLKRKKALDMGKPKRPPNSFLKFLENFPNRQPDEKYIQYLKRKSIEFQALSQTERDSLAPKAEDWEKYKKRLLTWEGEMVKGRRV